MKTKLFLLSYILIFALGGCSHKYGISKAHAYSRKVTAGNIPVDNAGRPTDPSVQKVHIVFIETAGDKPAWDTAWIEGKAYAIQPLKIEQGKTPLKIGKTKDEKTDVVVELREGNSLWQLMLTPAHAARPSENVYNKTTKNAVVLSGTWKTQRVTYGIKDQTELATIFSE